MKPPERKSGDHVSAIAASHEPSTAKLKAVALREGVNASQMARWLDVALGLAAKAKTSPVEFHHLETWLQRMRRVLP